MTSLAVGAVAGAALASSYYSNNNSNSNNNNNNSNSSSSNNHNEKHVGILAMETYTPSTFIRQSRLEEHTLGKASGKYTKGLGQEGLGVICGDAEDINSLCLTVVHQLLENYNIDPNDVGRLEVGTETLVDKSKSCKTVLMQLFPQNTDVEGATVVNACYGGTAALLNAFLWCESDGWDGRYAIVVAADIASYARGPARPTCGAGAVAILVGRNAPLYFQSKERATYASHVWDFFKPDPSVEYPVVDGALSQVCYYRALEDVYQRLVDKIEASKKRQQEGEGEQEEANVTVESLADYYCFHSPYNKLVQKSFARLYFLDARRQWQQQQQQQQLNGVTSNNNNKEEEEEEKKADTDNTNSNHPGSPTASNHDDDDSMNTTFLLLKDWLDKPLQETYTDKELEAVLKKLSQKCFAKKCDNANYASQWIGNTYTASVFFGLASLMDRTCCSSKRTSSLSSNAALTPGMTIAMFSYGSGALATMYRLHVRTPTDNSPFTVERMASTLQLTEKLERRLEIDPHELDFALETRARMHRAGAPYSPVYDTSAEHTLLFPGTYYLHGVDAQWRREYGRVPMANQEWPPSWTKIKEKKLLQQQQELADADVITTATTTSTTAELIPLAPPIVLRHAQREAVSQPVTGKLQVLLLASASSEDERCDESHKHGCFLEAQRRIACVITGTAAGLPGRRRQGREGGQQQNNNNSNNNRDDDDAVFQPDNLERLLAGHQCLEPISGSVKSALLEKNVVQLVKHKDKSTIRKPIDTEDGVIQLAAQLGSLDLTASYGVPPGLAQTMDVAAQVAVAAGMEALKNSGLVSGKSNDPKEWKLSLKYRDNTGVVYASSFPAMDAAVGEVMRFLQSRTVGASDSMRLIGALRSRLLRASPDRTLSEDDEAAFARILARAKEIESPNDEQVERYEFDRKFLFRVLVLGNAQLAQLAGIRGPNTQTNAACAGTTQAIAMAQDMLISGRAQRVVVVAGDNAAGETLLPWLGCGFSALGAATTQAAIEDAACPFDKRRSGLLLGAGGIGMVLETEASVLERQGTAAPHSYPFQVKARLLQTQYSNSAYHGAALDRKHIGEELTRFLADVELMHGISKAEVATHGVYFSHETSTHASDASSCAGNEIAALRHAFGDELLSKMLILNTKGFTGHPMGVSFEDVTAVEVLMRQTVPPIPNYKVKDEYLGDLKISKGGKYACRYALRFAAGFGSQVAFALYATAEFE